VIAFLLPRDFSMPNPFPRFRELLPYAAAAALGVLTAGIDVSAPFGDDTEKATLLLLAAFSGLLGFLLPRGPWRWALAVAVWLPLGHLVLHVLGLKDTINPNTYATILLLLPVSLVACSVGAYAGAFLRKGLSAAHPGP
jgi:hypothetical protein